MTKRRHSWRILYGHRTYWQLADVWKRDKERRRRNSKEESESVKFSHSTQTFYSTIEWNDGLNSLCNKWFQCSRWVIYKTWECLSLSSSDSFITTSTSSQVSSKAWHHRWQRSHCLMKWCKKKSDEFNGKTSNEEVFEEIDKFNRIYKKPIANNRKSLFLVSHRLLRKKFQTHYHLNNKDIILSLCLSLLFFPSLDD